MTLTRYPDLQAAAMSARAEIAKAKKAKSSLEVRKLLDAADENLRAALSMTRAFGQCDLT